MQVYTYCSYKGNYSGFQYAFFEAKNKNDIGKVEKIESVKNTDSFPKEFKQIKDILELKSGWKLILKKYTEKRGMLLIAKIEEEADTKKQKMLEELENEKLRNQFRGLQEDVNNISWEKVETDFFINLAFVGNMEYIQAIAAHYISDIISNETGKREDNNSWLKRMEDILEKSQDKETYLLNSDEYWEWFKEIINWANEEKTKEIHNENKGNELAKLKTKFWKKFYPHPYVRLENADRTKSRKNRIRDVKEQVINPLLNKIEFSQEYGLIMTNGGTLPEVKEANIVFDMEYLH